MNKSDPSHGKPYIDNFEVNGTIDIEQKPDLRTSHLRDIITSACCGSSLFSENSTALTTDIQTEADITAGSTTDLATRLRQQFYGTYDPSLGFHTAAVLGGILAVLILYLFYRTKCKKVIKKQWKRAYSRMGSGKDFRKKSTEKIPQNGGTMSAAVLDKSGTWIHVESPHQSLPCSEMDALEATALWIMQNHPLELQSLRDVTGIILRVDPGAIQSSDKHLCRGKCISSAMNWFAENMSQASTSRQNMDSSTQGFPCSQSQTKCSSGEKPPKCLHYPCLDNELLYSNNPSCARALLHHHHLQHTQSLDTENYLTVDSLGLPCNVNSISQPNIQGLIDTKLRLQLKHTYTNMSQPVLPTNLMKLYHESGYDNYAATCADEHVAGNGVDKSNNRKNDSVTVNINLHVEENDSNSETDMSVEDPLLSRISSKLSRKCSKTSRKSYKEMLNDLNRQFHELLPSKQSDDDSPDMWRSSSHQLETHV